MKKVKKGIELQERYVSDPQRVKAAVMSVNQRKKKTFIALRIHIYLIWNFPVFVNSIYSISNLLKGTGEYDIYYGFM